jgi:AcrR family transcriptional regulator
MKSTTHRDRQRRETRERILLAACKLFGRDGFSTVRTQDVALEAGVSHGAVFAHFLTRDALIAAAVEATVVRSANMVRHELRLTNSATGVLHAHLAVLAEHEGLHANIVAEQQVLPAEVQARLIEVNSGVATHLLASIEREGSGLPPGVEPSFVFNTWLALVHYYLVNRHLFAPGRSVLTERADELVRNYLTLVGGLR